MTPPRSNAHRTLTFKQIFSIKYLEQNKGKLCQVEKKLRAELSRYIEEKNEELRKTVEKQDPYWTKKIVAESVRKYLKKDIKEDIQAYMRK